MLQYIIFTRSSHLTKIIFEHTQIKQVFFDIENPKDKLMQC